MSASTPDRHPDRENISVVAAGSKTEVPFFARVLSGLGIPFVALVDQDPGKPTGEPLTQQIEQAAGTVGTVVLMQPDFEAVCGASIKFKPIDAMQLFASYTSKSQIPNAICEAIENLLPPNP